MASLYDSHLHALSQPPTMSSSTSSSSTSSTNTTGFSIPSIKSMQPTVPSNHLPISTPRRRLRDALKMEKVICQQLLQTGWSLVVRAGKKIDGKYGLVSAYAKFPDIRVTIYQTQSSQLQELYFKHEKDLPQCSAKERKAIVFAFINTLVFNGVNMLVPNPELEETQHSKQEDEEKRDVCEDFQHMKIDQ
jgi:hypothetical protein